MKRTKTDFPEELCKLHPEFENCESEIVKHGYNRNIYLLTTANGKKFIAKKENHYKDSGSSLLNDVRAQTFLASMDCDFVPQIIYWNKENDLLVESYVGDEDVDFSRITDGEIDTFVKQLAQIHAFSAKQYQDFSIGRGFGKPEIPSALDSLKTHGLDRFEIVKELCPDKKVKEWIGTRLDKNIANVKKGSKSPAHLQWGDIGGNSRKSSSKIFFIDWEFSSLGSSSELSYIKIHSHLPSEKLDYLVSRYAQETKKSKKELLKEMGFGERITRVNDVIWAAMKWGQATSKEDVQKYKELTFKRIGLAEAIEKK